MKNLLLLLIVILSLFGCKKDDPITTIDSLPSNVINKIIIDKQGVKWIATDKGLVSFDGITWKLYNITTPINEHSVTDVVFDTDMGLWVSSLKGVFKSTPSGRDLTNVITYKSGQNSLLSDSVFAISSNNENVGFFGTSKGLSIMKDSNWKSFYGAWGTGSTDDFLAKNKITGIASAKNGWNYVSTKGGGVSRFKYTDAVSGATKFFMPWASGLKSDTVYTVIVVNENCQWYGTNQGAAYHTSEFTKADWTSYSTADGLASDSVYAIAQDLSGNTWFGTARGVSRFDNSNWTTFTTADGLISNNIKTIAVDIDGSIWVGTDNGLSQYKSGNWIVFQKQ